MATFPLGTPDRPSTGHLFSSVTVPLISSPQFRGQPEENMIVRVVRFHRRIKTLKRQVYGRAGFDLLHKRILLIR